MSQLVKALVRVLDHAGTPLSGAAYRVRLYDQDALFDDFLCEGHPDADGRVELSFALAQVQSLDSPHETQPDLYVTVVRDGDELGRTRVKRDVDFRALPTAPHATPTVDLGELRLAEGKV